MIGTYSIISPHSPYRSRLFPSFSLDRTIVQRRMFLFQYPNVFPMQQWQPSRCVLPEWGKSVALN
ncbi:hypothetical protein RSAG8_10086, partial [Rhizoctonia solani AG-8 WAC10335]